MAEISTTGVTFWLGVSLSLTLGLTASTPEIILQLDTVEGVGLIVTLTVSGISTEMLTPTKT
jgi:hypothetical protein